MAGFNTAVTGLKSASQMLDVAGNNIANSSTVGFKSSRTEFADIYATSVVGAGASNQPGSGVTVSDISQDFSAGTIEFTNNNLDLAINGSGFFQLDDGQGGITYTRGGAFELDKDGFIVSKNGKNLQGYGLDALGNQLPLQDLAVTQKESAPKATEIIDLAFNIDSSADALQLNQTFDKNDPGSYTYSTTVETVDSLGNSNSIRYYVVEQRPVREISTYDISALSPAASLDVSGSTLFDFDSLSPAYESFSLTITDAANTVSSISGIELQANLVGATDSEITAELNRAINAANSTTDLDYVDWDSSGELTLVYPDWVNSGSRFSINTAGPNTQAFFGAVAYPAASTVPTTEDLVISGITLAFEDLLDLPTSVTTSPTISSEFALTDPRIDTETLKFDPSTGLLSFELNSYATQLGNVIVSGRGFDNGSGGFDNATELSLLGGATSERAANEVQTFYLDSGFFTSPSPGLPAVTTQSVNVTLGGIEILLNTGLTQDDVGDILESYERTLIEKNPDIESVTYDRNLGSFAVTWKSDAGDVDPLGVFSDSVTAPFVADPNNTTSPLRDTLKGDNSYQANYRLFGFLNDTEQLDLGKIVDPGESGFENDLTEVGSVLIKFDPTTGILSSVNGKNVANGGTAPSLTILGADPANPNDDLQESDTDGIIGIQLNITGTTQFASESIVKSASQDGYPKGDLIGVTFAETGEMVASFSNGQRQNLGLVAIASFENQAGLAAAGSTEWIATLNSGAAILNPPGTGLNGTLRSAALESSNVDLSAELVKLIEAQRNFQANSKTLETQNTVTQAILQI